jgi:nitrogenase molybdenum-iron protein alpha/beta subunit
MTDADRFYESFNFPWLMGVYLGVNAIPDAYALVDGPDCTLYKAHYIHGRHDWNSTLLDVSGQHRIAFTNVCARGVVKDHDEIVARHLRILDALPRSGLLFATALPMCSITGTDYGRIIRNNRALLHKTAIDVLPASLLGDWLDGYEAVLVSLARGLGLDRRRKRRGTAAVVGYLMDRNEADHRANLSEIRRMLAASGLELISVWLGGEPAGSLRRASEAEFVISLPYGRRAARAVARTTGARLIEAELPFGLPKTQAFVRRIAEATGRRREAEAFLAAELERVIPRLQWIVPHLFLHRRAAFIGDPHLLDGFCDIADDCGMTLTGAVVTGRAAHGGGRNGLAVLHEPAEASAEVLRMLDPAELVVGSRAWRLMIAQAGPHWRYPSLVELGFPSYEHHALLERPFLGADGVLGLVERMADCLYRVSTQPKDRPRA